MVLGQGVDLIEVASMTLCALVGRFSYHVVAKHNVGWWLEENWLPKLGDVP